MILLDHQTKTVNDRVPQVLVPSALVPLGHVITIVIVINIFAIHSVG